MQKKIGVATHPTLCFFSWSLYSNYRLWWVIEGRGDYVSENKCHSAITYRPSFHLKLKWGWLGAAGPKKLRFSLVMHISEGPKCQPLGGVFSKFLNTILLRLQILIELDEFYQNPLRNILYQLWNRGGGVRICTGCHMVKQNLTGQ